MKTIQIISALALVFFTAASCESDDSEVLLDPLADLTKVQTFKANDHSIEIYAAQQQFTIGYNELFIRIKEDATDAYIPNVQLSWSPVMHMTSKEHSCPKSEIVTTSDANIAKGYIVFQMPGNADEYWDLKLDYTIENESFTVTERIEVQSPPDGKKTINTFMGTDNARYILAMMPFNPEVKVNDFSAMLFKMETMMSFPAVENYKINLDPRMPSMGNHSSPNNEDLSYKANARMYSGKLSLTMTGYWKLNLKLENATGDLLKGEDITDTNESSSLFFEIEF
tara:strand:- start:80291 stop:81136 length:846 start_codon:yes stop_codon:yes gene_type:complete